MRMILKAALAILPAAVFMPTTVNAAQESWRQACSGPAYVCGEQAAAVAPAKAKAIAKAKPAAQAPKAKKAYAASADAPKSKTKQKTASKAKASSGSGGGSAFQSGMASWYGGKFHGRKTANGETYNMNSLTAAHKTLPFGTRVRVTNTRSGASVDVRINDRGPFIAGRVIDLSRAAAGSIGLTNTGVAPVKVTILGKG